MKIKQIMHTSFEVCSLGDAVITVVKKMTDNNRTFIAALDLAGKYIGIIDPRALVRCLAEGDNCTIEGLVIRIEAIEENSDIRDIKKIRSDAYVLPVINSNKNVVGFLNLRTIINNLDIDSERMLPASGKNNSKYVTKYNIDNILGESKQIILLKKRILAAAKTNATVLIMGETGTGKELVAHSITALSSRRHQPFVRINCAAIPSNLLESELFGYEEGAFTGALKGGSKGKFLQANNGTIFLDEIGDMPLELQAKILRVLQEREIERIGGSYPIPIDVRIIAATHANLFELVKQNKFRQDLFFRLHVIPITVPPLRERKEDIPILIEPIIEELAGEMGKEIPSVEPSFIKALMDYNWLGNVRELLNVLQMVISFSEGSLTDKDLREYFILNQVDTKINVDKDDLKSLTDEVEKDRIIKAMKNYGGNKIKVADALGISRSNLYYKMKKYNL
ncbi:acetoin dehydrogenase operon transcriptional activator AcoR [Clostridium homopropionicum DSM 5847]|uniref:Acetoin dehydrogenase operon transcriptional activator AcoR n=1 Tax=Clostridium homopropionicum DSM 5847 TaxID=1121318 RepID=A0A0L6Z7H9_9CLOT|nr:sigma 54-interacting transcriptional regulator [Clostridium homopropionicum]KOA18926.1 acetoin dehydrogenase operon transcriptional activator AcoR [Clostridium homopropionicum DSM 5847]SFG44312.1 regulatory protein, Fis family [Clostridium homopropionicum]